jgi:formylglycine-generating enzyme required for sulfatase activity
VRTAHLFTIPEHSDRVKPAPDMLSQESTSVPGSTSKKVHSTHPTWLPGWESWRCNSSESGINRTSAVGCFPGGESDWWRVLQPDSEVVHDLAGNVWEWTASEYTEDYSGANRSVMNTNPGSPCVLRGGSWNDRPRRLRGAARSRLLPFVRYFYKGFRLARTFSL